MLLKRENTSLKQEKSLASLAQAARLIISDAFFFVFRTQNGSHVKEHNEGVKSQIKEIKEDINRLRLGNDGFNVEVKLDELEQYARRDCLEITGIPVVPNDSPALLVKEMSEIMGVNLNENDISIAHRLPPTKKVKDRLIVKFTRREKRDEIYSKRKNFKSKGRTIRKLMGGGGGEVQKKYSRKGKLNEKRFMHAN